MNSHCMVCGVALVNPTAVQKYCKPCAAVKYRASILRYVTEYRIAHPEKAAEVKARRHELAALSNGIDLNNRKCVGCGKTIPPEAHLNIKHCDDCRVTYLRDYIHRRYHNDQDFRDGMVSRQLAYQRGKYAALREQKLNMIDKAIKEVLEEKNAVLD